MVIVKMPERIRPSFHRYIGIGYSGAETPNSSLKGLRVYEASRDSLAVEVVQPPGCGTWIWMEASANSSTPRCCRESTTLPRVVPLRGLLRTQQVG